ncbi:hypothetical protein PLICRDRAFT_35713 [Plicaturopsis crispa FD-325 SS-3]|nr:hypothetical protein PLICRDRAFT_35713 [Plicaturopsis crispa FD-325 SS-3]
MTRLAVSVALVLTVFLQVQGGLAGPACVRRNQKADACAAKCASKWGWPGMAMGTDPWGAVMKPAASEDPSSIVAQACGSSTSASVQSTSAASSPTAAGPAKGISAPSSTSVNATTSATSSSSSSVTTSSSSSSSSSSSPPSSSATHSSVRVNKAVVASATSSSSSSTSEAKSTSTPPPPPKTTSTPPPAPKPTSTSSSKAAAPSQTQSSGGGGGSSSTSGSDEQQYLSAHNSFRAQHGASALTWSDNLASKAQQWANNCQFKHSGGTLGPFGENIAAGTGDSYDIAAAIKSWTDESSQYDPNNPQPSHFTQVVWKGSSQLGCAEAQCNGIFDSSFGPAKFFVCEYEAQGNIIGNFPANVQA